MPLMDGFELCQKLLEKDINVKVCFMTSGEINIVSDRIDDRTFSAPLQRAIECFKSSN
jgi:FixJ family two-component response regulator